MSRVVVVGGGLGGLALSALVGRYGHEVTLLEANPWLGGKSRRIELDGRRMDTGPSLVTFPGVWEEYLRRWDVARGEPGEAAEVAGLKLGRLPEVGRYFWRGETTTLPVERGHPWHEAWERFAGVHGGLGPEVTRLLTADPIDRKTLPALARLLRVYGPKLTTRSYLDGLSWLPEGLREIIAIHTLNAGVAPTRTPALYASMPAIMASDGVFVPEGGVYEVVLSLEKLARRAGVEIKTGEPVREIGPGKVVTTEGEYAADAVVGDLDAGRLERLVGPAGKGAKKRGSPAPGSPCTRRCGRSCPEESRRTASCCLRTRVPCTRAWKPGRNRGRRWPLSTTTAGVRSTPTRGGTLAVLLTAPANGREYRLDDPFVQREIERVSVAAGLPGPATRYFGDYGLLRPRVLRSLGKRGRGALRGRAPFLEERAVSHAPLQRP